MDVWFLHSGETVPTDGDVRLFRYGQMCQMLAADGHTARHWASGFNHFTKQFRCQKSETHEVEPGYFVELLATSGYRQHVSFQRIWSHQGVAAEFRKHARQRPRPDIIVASLPTLENCEAALEYGREYGVPVVVDVRDLWPDAFLTPVPSFLRPLVKPLLFTFERQAQRICREATALVGVSEEYLDWGLQKAGRSRKDGDRVIHHAFERPQLTAEVEMSLASKWEPLGITAERGLRVCYFGTLGRSAGIGVLAQTARLLAERGRNDIEFVICGGGPREQELKSAVDGLPNVQLPGWVKSDEVAWMMSRSDIGFAAYEANVFQSLPNKPIEYLGGGLPVLTTLPGELSDLLHKSDCGASFKVSDCVGMANWLEMCADNPQRRNEMAGNASRLYQEQFAASIVYREFIDYLLDISAPTAIMRAA